jgi:hypothetical protein
MSRIDEERERRLAAALRDNLKRRKAQARADAPGAISPPVGEEPPAPVRPESEQP